MADAKAVVKKRKEAETKYVDFRFTDPRGKWQHVAFDIGMCDEDALKEGIMFDGSSIAGWKAINESDMLLMPDLDSLTFDPFAAQTTAVLFCDVLNPGEGTPYNRRSEEHTSELQSLMRTSYAVFCLQKKTTTILVRQTTY